uniref:N-acetyltransferase domain-containing protein n=1 Tax=Rhizochromulina marina TaxID=1034831 RepID=A0A7S2WC10_9STRA
MAGARSVPVLDFRFADEEDVDDIVRVVNDAFAGPDHSFRAGPRLARPLVVEDTDRPGQARWLLLETPAPEENVVASVRLQLDDDAGLGRGKMAILTALAVHPDWRGKGVGSLLLRKCEASSRGLGCRSISIDLPMSAESVQSWLSRRGWKQLGGGLWEGDGYDRAMNYVTYVRDLTCKPGSGAPISAPASSVVADPSPGSSTVADAGIALGLATSMAELLGSLPPAGAADAAGSALPAPAQAPAAPPRPPAAAASGTGGEDLEGLLGQLMSQLQTESGRAQFTALATAEEANSFGKPV